ncbi:MAG: SprB repeat-containing protein [Sphingobacteriales bacterium]|jgi:hypothetical protein|nr:SprB repeat-containing protein [Sphingobacteriales bacterium]MBP9141975.1 SprB repeat-containing protein [Chitinophagales bacterium]MDA0198846.1 T9SS type A sorting domain-containing protein [Bacteroidota bacterium]MBK6890225.1 SprB repeat-containing protein [Sphingobacteriales bacterium]MBK7527248.1 SprB repeat-containing protein [Sphingobacteriales bacterium]
MKQLYLLISMLIVVGISIQAQTPADSLCINSGYYLSLNINEITCPGGKNGSLTVASTGCQCAFSGCLFNWSSGGTYHTVDNLAAGTYSVTVTHPNGCILDTSYTLQNPQSFINSFDVVPSTCKGNIDGWATLIPADNAGPLTFLWSNGDNDAKLGPVPAGQYTITATNAIGCSMVETVTIGSIAPPQVDKVTVINSCSNGTGGSAEVFVSGGTAPYTYKWSDKNASTTAKVENMAAGNYSVIITDAKGCEVIKTGIIIEKLQPKVSIEAEKTSVCSGTGVHLTAKSAWSGDLTYEWLPAADFNDPAIASPIATPTKNTTYKLTITTAEGCQATAYSIINTWTLPKPTATATNDTICYGQTTQLIATEPSGATFSWSPASSLNNPNINAPIASPIQSTTYTVTATNYLGCVNTASVGIEVETCNTAINDGIAANETGWKVSPNPATNYLQIQYPDAWANAANASNMVLQLYNTLGQSVLTMPVLLGGNEFKTSQIALPTNLSAGVYLVSLLSQTSKTPLAQQRIVITK